MRVDRTLAGVALGVLAAVHLPRPGPWLAPGPWLTPGPPVALADSGGEGGEGGNGEGGSNSGSGGEGGDGGGSGGSGSDGGGGEGGEGGGSDDGGSDDGGSDDGGGASQDDGGSDTVAAPSSGTVADAAFTRPDGRGDVVPDEILVMVDARAVLPETLLDGGFHVLETRSLAALGLSITRLRLPRGMSPETARAVLLRRYPGLVVDLHRLYRPAAGEPLTAPDGAWRQIGWSPELASCPGVVVGMIDTAIDGATRAGMGGRLVAMRFADAGGTTDHGSTIASLLVGGRPGPVPALLPSGRLFAADVFGPMADRPLGSVVAVAAALDWLAAESVPVAGISLEGSPSEVLALAVARAADRGLVLVAAAGNGGPDAPPAYPAALPDVIAVSAVDGLGEPYAAGTRGDYVDVAAPGVGLWVNDGAGAGRRVSGTSYAVPFVTAALAVEARRMRIDPNSAAVLLAARAVDLGASGRDPIYGAGLLRAPDRC